MIGFVGHDCACAVEAAHSAANAMKMDLGLNTAVSLGSGQSLRSRDPLDYL
jgi:hypothetical protein